MSLPVNCVNCGKENLWDGGMDETCVFCGLLLRKKGPAEPVEIINKKEVVMQNKGTVPSRLSTKKRRNLWEYMDQNKEEILADYRRLRLKDFFKRWSMCTSTWAKLKIKWGVKGKGKAISPRRVTETLTEHERYLILVGYQMATREILQAQGGEKMIIKCIGCLDLIREELEMPGKVVVYTCRRFPFSAEISGLLRPGKGILKAVDDCPRHPETHCILCAQVDVLHYGDDIVAICKEHDRAWTKWLDALPGRRAYLSPKGRMNRACWIEVFREFIEDMRSTA